MLHDSPQLVGNSKITSTLVEEDKRGPSFPVSPADGDTFHLTEVSGDYGVGLHVYSGEASDWLPLENLSNVPYDIALIVFDRPRSSDIVCKHLSTRNFMFNPNFGESLARANVAATADYTFEIFRVALDGVTETKIGELQFLAGETWGTFTPVTPDVALIFVRGQTVLIRSPEVRDSTLKNVDITIVGELLVQGV